MPCGERRILGKPVNQEKWERAKIRAAEEGHESDYDYIMDIYKKMAHLGEFKQKYIRERKKTGEPLPEWKRRRWNPKEKKVKKSFSLIISAADLEEFRCGNCNALLFKGLHLEKARFEVICRSCKNFLVSPGIP